MCVFSLPNLSSAVELSSSQLLEKISGNLNKIISDGSHNSPKASQKSRQDLEVLFNTSWEFSYSLDGAQHVSKMDLSDNISTSSDGTEGVKGSFFRDVNGGNTDGVACLFVGDEPDLGGFLGINYLCAVQGSPFLSFGFKISGDSIVNGIFASGTSAEEMAIDLVTNQAPMTGFRIGSNGSGTIPVIPQASEASYDDTTNELIIPVVNYRGAKYRVILQDTGNLVFTIKDAVPSN